MNLERSSCCLSFNKLILLPIGLPDFFYLDLHRSMHTDICFTCVRNLLVTLSWPAFHVIILQAGVKTLNKGFY